MSDHGCTCPPIWHGIVPPPCAAHNPGPAGIVTTTTNVGPTPMTPTEPTTAAGRELMGWLYGKPPEVDKCYRNRPGELILAIEAESAEQEADRWRRLPGSYRREDGGMDVIVDVPESASFLLDEYPDEVALIQKRAVAAWLASDAGREAVARALTVYEPDTSKVRLSWSREDPRVVAGPLCDALLKEMGTK